MKKILIFLFMVLAAANAYGRPNVKGRVLADGKPLAGVAVSDGNEIVLTDENGRYALDSDKSSTVVFITTPSGYCAVTKDGIRPCFWQYLSLPVDQEEIHDFSLISEDQSIYTVMFITDIHLKNEIEKEDIARFRNIVMPFIRKHADKAGAKGPVYTFNLGDFTHDIFWYKCDFNEADGLRLLQDENFPTKIYAVSGNHDNDGAIVGENVDFRAAWMYRNVWGPDRYSVNIGRDHWIFLDNIIYKNIEGKGKKSPGIKGDRSYDEAFTQSQLDWLEKDIALVSPDTPIHICTHAPLLSSRKAKGNTTVMPKEQMKRIEEMVHGRKGTVEFYSGHIHRYDFCDNEKYPCFRQYSLTCSSGIMWDTRKDWPMYCSDGSDAGMCIGTYCITGKNELHLHSYAHGEKYYRVYDMNEVGKAYKKSAGAKKQHKLFPDTRAWYADKEYKNWVYVNYWGYMPGDRIEMFENGEALEVVNTRKEDPSKNFAYELPLVESELEFTGKHAKDSAHRMYGAKTKSAKSTVTLKISDRDGNVRFEEEIVRPLPFDPSK